jgi:hypothetical protein
MKKSKKHLDLQREETIIRIDAFSLLDDLTDNHIKYALQHRDELMDELIEDNLTMDHVRTLLDNGELEIVEIIDKLMEDKYPIDIIEAIAQRVNITTDQIIKILDFLSPSLSDDTLSYLVHYFKYLLGNQKEEFPSLGSWHKPDPIKTIKWEISELTQEERNQLFRELAEEAKHPLNYTAEELMERIKDATNNYFAEHNLPLITKTGITDHRLNVEYTTRNGTSIISKILMTEQSQLVVTEEDLDEVKQIHNIDLTREFIIDYYGISKSIAEVFIKRLSSTV